MSHGINIGALAKRTQCQAETIRYYEREGLLPPPARSQGNYRQYDTTHVERLSFIRHCRSLDMTLDEIRALLDMALPAAWTSTELYLETIERALQLSASQEDPLTRARTRARSQSITSRSGWFITACQ